MGRSGGTGPGGGSSSGSGRRRVPRIEGQHGALTVTQLAAAGWTRAMVRHAVASGRWRTVLPRVVMTHTGPIGPDAQRMCASLWAGPDAVLTGSAALEAQGISTKPGRPRPLTFLVPPTRRTRRAKQVRTRRTSRLPGFLAVGALRVAEPARALVDAAVIERLPPSELESVTVRLLQQGRCTPEQLEREVLVGGPARTRGIIKGLEMFTHGAWSHAEHIAAGLVAEEPRLPEMLLNPRLETPSGRYLGLPDGYFPTVGVAVQVHSRRYHQGVDDAGGDRWARTVEGDAAMVAAGIRVVGVTPWTLHRRPQEFIRRLLATIEAAEGGPRPDVVVKRAAPRHR